MRAGTLHDLDNIEFLERYPVDMNLVAAKALADLDKRRRRYHLEFDCEGHPYIWDGEADSEGEAISLGRLAIFADGRFDSTARVVVCLERRA